VIYVPIQWFFKLPYGFLADRYSSVFGKPASGVFMQLESFQNNMEPLCQSMMAAKYINHFWFGM